MNTTTLHKGGDGLYHDIFIPSKNRNREIRVVGPYYNLQLDANCYRLDWWVNVEYNHIGLRQMIINFLGNGQRQSAEEIKNWFERQKRGHRVVELLPWPDNQNTFPGVPVRFSSLKDLLK
jgi:hypothetical protein